MGVEGYSWVDIYTKVEMVDVFNLIHALIGEHHILHL